MQIDKAYSILLKLGAIQKEETSLEDFRTALSTPEGLFEFVSDLRLQNDDNSIDEILFCFLSEVK